MIESILQTGIKHKNQTKQKDILNYSHYIDILLLILSYVSLMSCLIRSDYNFAIAFFAYFLKQQKLSLIIVKLQIALFLITIIYDIAYTILDVRVWYKIDDYQPIWQTVFPMHTFVTSTFLLEFLLKIITLILLFVLKGIYLK